MRFAVVTLGSAGDLHPFLAVARALVERGHEVYLLTQAPYEAAVRAEGVGFMAIASQMEHDRTLQHPLLWHPLHGFGVLWRHLAVPAIGPTIEALDGLSGDGGSLTVLASPLAAGARLARARWPERIRLLSGYTAPMGLRSTADPMFLGAWQVPGWMPSVARRGLWTALDRWKLEPMARPALRRWFERLALQPFPGSLFGDGLHSPDGGVALYPDWFAPVPEFWRARGVNQTGFPVFEPSNRPELPSDLASFVREPGPYVVVYPGSADQRAQAFADRAVAACRALGRRVLLLSRFARGTDMVAPGVLRVDEAPLGDVLPRASAFVHHGGIGSVAQGFAAQVPQLLLASAYDQFENGARVERLGQGRWQQLSQASAMSIQDQLNALSGGGVGALPGPPKPSGPDAPNAAIEDTGSLLESMRGQFDLPGFDSPKTPFELDAPGMRGKPKSYTLFLAIFPPEDTAQQLDGVAARLAKQHGLATGQRVSSSRLHITLHEVAHFSADERIRRDVVDAVIAAGDRVVSPALHLIFDRAMSFRGSDAFVLRCDTSSDAAVARLRQVLASELRRVSLRPKPSPTPHMTMLYDRKHISEHPIEPIQWTATRFALVVSHVGLTHHQWVREWPLTPAA